MGLFVLNYNNVTRRDNNYPIDSLVAGVENRLNQMIGNSIEIDLISGNGESAASSFSQSFQRKFNNDSPFPVPFFGTYSFCDNSATANGNDSTH